MDLLKYFDEIEVLVVRNYRYFNQAEITALIEDLYEQTTSKGLADETLTDHRGIAPIRLVRIDRESPDKNERPIQSLKVHKQLNIDPKVGFQASKELSQRYDLPVELSMNEYYGSIRVHFSDTKESWAEKYRQQCQVPAPSSEPTPARPVTGASAPVRSWKAIGQDILRHLRNQ